MRSRPRCCSSGRASRWLALPHDQVPATAGIESGFGAAAVDVAITPVLSSTRGAADSSGSGGSGGDQAVPRGGSTAVAVRRADSRAAARPVAAATAALAGVRAAARRRPADRLARPVRQPTASRATDARSRYRCQSSGGGDGQRGGDGRHSRRLLRRFLSVGLGGLGLGGYYGYYDPWMWAIRIRPTATTTTTVA